MLDFCIKKEKYYLGPPMGVLVLDPFIKNKRNCKGGRVVETSCRGHVARARKEQRPMHVSQVLVVREPPLEEKRHDGQQRTQPE